VNNHLIAYRGLKCYQWLGLALTICSSLLSLSFFPPSLIPPSIYLLLPLSTPLFSPPPSLSSFLGFGFVTFENEEPAEKVCSIQYHDIKGKKVEVKVAQTKEAIAMQQGRGRVMTQRNYGKVGGEGGELGSVEW
jgi:hypothetical protein